MSPNCEKFEDIDTSKAVRQRHESFIKEYSIYDSANNCLVAFPQSVQTSELYRKLTRK